MQSTNIFELPFFIFAYTHSITLGIHTHLWKSWICGSLGVECINA